MAIIPAALLKKVYEPGSLRNNDQGFELALKNRLAPTTLVGVGPVRIDEQTYQAEELTICVERPAERHGRPLEPLVWAAADVGKKKAVLPFGVNTVLRLMVEGVRLPAGEHEIACSLKTREVGDIVVKAMDRVAE